MTYQHLQYAVAEGIGTITFNRPDQLNAMNRRLMEELMDAIHRLDGDEAARVGLLTGAGRAFMAGADLKEYARRSDAEFASFQILGRGLYAALEGNRKPVVAAVNGHALGGGFEIALACDLIVAAEGAKLGLPEILLHLIPGGGGTQRLPRKLGLTRANELLFTGRLATASELHAWGVVNHVYARETFASDAHAFAATIADKSADALRTLKQLTQLAAGPFNPAAQALENEALERLHRTDAARAKLAGFVAASEARAAAKNP
ncbi:MAG: enoyl-CoA hydratase/isomerase family protein [Opitutales bacterium]|nr:enoyl-CoA hydratase/isomerase family protein [Opitutales bacterium]